MIAALKIKEMCHAVDIGEIIKNLPQILQKYKLKRFYELSLKHYTKESIQYINIKLSIMIYFLEIIPNSLDIKQKVLLAIMYLDKPARFKRDNINISDEYKQYYFDAEFVKEVIRYTGFFKRKAKNSKLRLVTYYKEAISLSIIFNNELEPKGDKSKLESIYFKLLCYTPRTREGSSIYLMYNYPEAVKKNKHKFIK